MHLRKSYISYWAEQKVWPEEYFQQNIMHRLIARRKLSASLYRKRSDASLTTSVAPSDQWPREDKSAPYKNPSYPALLETLGNSYMEEHDLGVTDASRNLCHDLLEKKYPTPKDTLFRDHDALKLASRNLQNRNEAKIVQDIARLLVPSPERLTVLGAKHLEILAESVNEGWNNCITITSTRPQPDLAVGFKKSAFSDVQLSKLQPILGGPIHLSYLKATHYMYFPFLSSETKSGTTGLDVADRQNLHTMTVSVRALVEIFRLTNREMELHRENLGFSFSHDHRTVRIYGHYPVIEGSKPKYYREPIRTLDFTMGHDGDEWISYNFARGIYDHSLILLEKICSVIDELPDGLSLDIPD